MQTQTDDIPSTFREVAIILRQVKEDVDELKESQKRITGIVITSILSPLIVGVVLGFILR